MEGVEAVPPTPRGSVELMAAMFPGVDKELLEEILAHHANDIERAVTSLIELSGESEMLDGRTAQEDLDAQIAMAEQEEVDAEMARALTAALQEEERQRASAHPSRTPSTASASSIAASAKSILARVRAARRRHATDVGMNDRLLESEPEGGDSSQAITQSVEPLYSPPPIPPTQTNSQQPNDLMTMSTIPPTSSKYTSRVDRARAANALRNSRNAGAAAPVMVQIDPSQFASVQSSPEGYSDQPGAPVNNENRPAEGVLI